MTNDVNDLLRALHDGQMTLDEVAARFRERTWPRRGTRLATYTELATAELADPEPYVPGSFDDVTLAYHKGELSDEQYDVLAAAMAQSKQAQDDGR
jgi:hypothetical protein